MITPEQLKKAFSNDPKTTSKALADSLRDFGYSVTDEWVEEETKRLLNNEAPRGGPALFIKRWLEEGID